ncbi:MAG: cbb3-type cytochrome c oxidase subunit I [Chloroflexi bacterium]|nr:cbb3-type cytochrome c oxidase subunit I [Chloroflexota bacterium]
MSSKSARADYWTCAVTGLRVHEATVPPLLVNAVTAIGFLLLGGLLSVLLALTRWEAVHLLPANWYYVTLTLHAWSMLGFWMIFFEIAILYFASSVVLQVPLASLRAAWLAYVVMIGGALLAAVTVLVQGDGWDQPLLTSYAPLKIHPLFLLGAIIFAVGAFVGLGLFFATVWRAQRADIERRSLPLVVFGAVVAAIIATESLLGGAVAYGWYFLYTIGVIPTIDAEMYRVLFWLLGHGSQQINLAAMVTSWYLLAYIAVGARTVSEKVSRTAFIMYALFINLGAAHHILSDPGVSNAWRIFNASYAVYGAVMASLIHAFAIPGSVEWALRRQGHTGLFGWLRNAPWGNPAFASLAVSLTLFGVLGGITGVTFGTEQLNMMVHNTLAIPGHFHATVVAGTTIAFMGIAYQVIQLIARRDLLSRQLATFQLYFYGAAMAAVSVAMIWLGYFFGTPRRHAATAALSIVRSPLLEAVLGIAAMLAVVGGILFLALAVLSLLGGSRRPVGPRLAPIAGGADARSTSTPSPEAAPVPHDLSGTLTLCLIFLALLLAIYATHWVNLASLWGVR